MRNKRVILFITFLIILTWISQSFSLSKPTHEAINQYIAQNTVNDFSLNTYLKNNLGFNAGEEEPLIGVDSKGIETEKRVFEWFGYGGIQEDIPPEKAFSLSGAITFLSNNGRANNHFHNPLITDWNNAGLNKTIKLLLDPVNIISFIPFIASGTCNYTLIPFVIECGFTGQSSVLWSQNPDQDPNQEVGGEWSWQDAREYFYIALTGRDFAGSDMPLLPDETEEEKRERYFADTFRAVGQLMHLVHDASVPEHTRNDIHVRPAYEGVVENIRNTTTQWNDWMNNPISFDKSILDIPSGHPSAQVPISRIIDTDLYTGNNPEVTTTFGSLQYIGIAEYTNANFFSKDTIDASNFPNPQITQDTPIVERMITNTRTGTIYSRRYYSGYISGQDYLLLAVDRLDYYRNQYPLLSVALLKIPVLDDYVYEEYADLLIPRAIGYSAGLLDYFFRGELYVALLVPSVDEVSLTFGNQNDTGSDIDTVAVFIQNNSKIDDVIEPIGEGTLTLTISYTDSTSGSTFYESADTVSVTQIPEKDSGSYFTFLFTLTSPIPTQTAEDITYYFAFRGQLGNEEDAVIGKVIKGPLLYSVSPDEGIEEEVVTLTGNNLPTIDGPFPITSEDVRFHHDLTKPYTVEVINKTDTDITVKVPNTAGLLKPGYGGQRVRNILDTGEKIYSNPVSFFPIAEGEVKNIGQTTVDVTIEAIGPIVGDYNQLPQTINISGLAPSASQPIQLMTGFTYTATANTSDTQDIELLTPDAIDFVFEVE